MLSLSLSLSAASTLANPPHPEYKSLEQRCDALRNAHSNLIKITKVYSTETYDYPTNINETLGDFGANVSHGLTFWAAQATKGTNLPKVEPTDKPVEQKKTLPHALSRAAAGGGFGRLPEHT